MPTTYSFDHTGTLPANRITGEQHALMPWSGISNHFIVPTFAPFFLNSLFITYRNTDGSMRTLTEGIDYCGSFQFIGASRACTAPIYGGVSFLDTTLTGTATIVYQTIGGTWTIDNNQIATILSDTLRNPKITSWETIANIPFVFPVINHPWNLDDMVGMSDVADKINDVALAIANKVINLPVANVTKASIGLASVDNYSTAGDADTIAGTSATKFTTPHGVKAAIQASAGILNSNYHTKTDLATKPGANYIGTQAGITLANAGLTVRTLAELKALAAPNIVSDANLLITVLGGTDIGDGDTRQYYWSRFNIETPNGVTVVAANTAPSQGRWVSLDHNSWMTINFTATAGLLTYKMSVIPLNSNPPKIVVNNVIELMYGRDFRVDGDTIVFKYTLEADDQVSMSVQIKEHTGNRANTWIAKTYTVNSQSDVFLLPRLPVDPNNIKVILNEFITLNKDVDFTINGLNIQVTYPIEYGDTLEAVSINSGMINYAILE